MHLKDKMDMWHVKNQPEVSEAFSGNYHWSKGAYKTLEEDQNYYFLSDLSCILLTYSPNCPH